MKPPNTDEWINNIPKTINHNGCWIPDNITPNSNGYCRVVFDYQIYYLHRLSVSIYNNLDYFNQSWDTRHGENCDRACFNPEHLKYGTTSDNARDAVKHKTNVNSRKEKCPKCDSDYRTMTIKTGWNRGRTFRVCDTCVAINGIARDKREREKTKLRKSRRTETK